MTKIENNSLQGIIYARDATEISEEKPLNDKEQGEHCRYKDGFASSVYLNGFGYDKDLDSYVWNGFLHEVTTKIAEIEKGDTTYLGDLLPHARYTSTDEAKNGDFLSDDSYLKKELVSQARSARFDLYTGVKNSDMHKIASDGINANCVLTNEQAKTAKAIFNGVNFPLHIVEAPKTYALEEIPDNRTYDIPRNKTLCIIPPDTAPDVSYVKVAVNLLSPSTEPAYYGVLNTLKKDKKLIVLVEFLTNGRPLSYRGFNIPLHGAYEANKFEVICDSNKVYFLSGWEIPGLTEHNNVTESALLDMAEAANG